MNYESDREIRREALDESPDDDSLSTAGESHATTGGAAAAGAVTGGVIGLTGGPVGAAIGAVGGAIVGAAAERMMHSDDGDRVTTPDETDAYAETTPLERQPRDVDKTPTEIEEPVGEPLADVEPEHQEHQERKEPRPLI